ncbi:3,4-dihydroxyphenylacetate 2,3-dioxygenase [Kyrpidia tusciae]|uniref:3,4-dihydroxyphenylacetate 2,3-dioxygenase n=1 Tax=Kyrpidia tusciae (strain DSM 2912 / NBRC 15312 / T2) TaxID=562970 RepID=D5WPM3_KYRT2|nr:3,4-dihydroxyphenylacetate 2,3-dioxygenase [Kyrpidia tusciae]ADG06282.1 3,4-dihydroxyphenylacetate 2,3-dioxygenase [Kyrpidia tusciae DSM 2912]
MRDFEILRTAHVEYRVTDLDRARAFYVETLGFVETASDERRMYLRGYEDRFHHSLVLTKSPSPGVSHVAFRVRSDDEVRAAATFMEGQGLTVRWMDDGEERGQGLAFRVQDPFGFPVEFFAGMEEVEWYLQRFDLHRGANILRIDHVNFFTPEVQRAYDWYTGELGFQCSEYTVTDDDPPRLWGSWLRRKATSHDLAISMGTGPQIHHASFVVDGREHILRIADVLAAKGYYTNIERGPGRHGTTNAFFLYLRDPDGNRIELFTGDYLIADPDWRPVQWKISDPMRQTFWGAAAPRRWFNEAMAVESVLTGELLPVTAPETMVLPPHIADD